MDKIKSLLTNKILKTNAKMWHLLVLLTILWIVPAFLPETIWQNFTFFIFAVWIILYILLTRILRTVLRLTRHDAILFERYFIFLSFLISSVYGLLYGFRHTFDTGLAISLVLSSAIALLLIISIIIHVKTSDKYYHGINKEDLLK